MDEIIIDENNITEFLDQDLEGLQKLLQCEVLSIDTTPKPIESTYKICKCGAILFEAPKGEFRCGQCGCILY